MTEKQENKITFIHTALVERCRKGDSSAQAEIYHLYFRAMYNISLRITGNTAEAEDVMQESFLKAFRNISSCKENATFGAWLKRIVVNQSIDALRQSRKIQFEGEDKINSLPPEEDAAGISEELLVGEIAESIKIAVNALPEGYRVIVSLRLLEGYDHEEIGGILGIRPSTSRSQYARGRQKLIELLKDKKIIP